MALLPHDSWGWDGSDLVLENLYPSDLRIRTALVEVVKFSFRCLFLWICSELGMLPFEIIQCLYFGSNCDVILLTFDIFVFLGARTQIICQDSLRRLECILAP